ncbi:TniB family NTP-binding protein [Nocardioides rotundus]|uniref:TniB family NTP-binding protein n=1 Tax=Nocardioides rotundus TaxID=1774216 RepID=UPI001CBE2565|nr:TniB family NTP-binding protein [Nocardioides rotundus]UAL29910.1 TniB family NTP-binding protein [Nocardioides rotundus]
MDAAAWHMQAMTPPPELPDPMTKAQWSAWSETARASYVRAFRVAMRARPFASPIHERVAERMTASLGSALLEPAGARTILALSAPFSAGKSTMVKAWAQHLHRSVLAGSAPEFLPRWNPTPGLSADTVPVSYVTLLSDSRGTDLYAQLLNFANKDAGGSVRAVVQFAIRALKTHGTRLVVIDDAHMLRTTSVTGRATLNALKHLNTELGELGGVLVLVGADLTGGDVLADPQIRGRLAQHTFGPYEIDTDDGRRAWQRFLKAAETTLLPYLPDNSPGDIAQGLAEYLWIRTTGFVGDASRLLIDGTCHAMNTGQRLDRFAMDPVAVSQRAHDAQQRVELLRRPLALAGPSAGGEDE